MSSHTPSPADSGKKSNPVGMAIIATVCAVTLIVGIALLAKFAVGTHTLGAAVASANTPEAIAARVGPMVQIAVETPAPAAKK